MLIYEAYTRLCHLGMETLFSVKLNSSHFSIDKNDDDNVVNALLSFNV